MNAPRDLNIDTTCSQPDWIRYYDAMRGSDARDTVVDASSRFGDRRGLAIDAGCGEGRDTAHLLASGWEVLAFDPEPEAITRLRERTGDAPGLRTVVCGADEFAWEPALLVNASFSLAFMPDLDEVMARVRDALVPGGRFAGQIFGDRDSWASIPGRSHRTRQETLGLLGGLTLERFDEIINPGNDAFGIPKNWHVFHIVARR